MKQIETLQRLCEEAIVLGPDSAGPCNNIMNYIDEASGFVLEYDSRIFDYEWDPIDAMTTNYLQSNA